MSGLSPHAWGPRSDAEGWAAALPIRGAHTWGPRHDSGRVRVGTSSCPTSPQGLHVQHEAQRAALGWQLEDLGAPLPHSKAAGTWAQREPSAGAGAHGCGEREQIGSGETRGIRGMGEDILWRHTGIGTWEGEVWRDTAAPEPSPHPGGASASQQDAEGATSPDLSVPPESHGGSPARTHSSPPTSQGPQAAGKPLSPPQPPTRPPNPWRNKAPPLAQWGWEDEAGPRTNELTGAWPPHLHQWGWRGTAPPFSQ